MKVVMINGSPNEHGCTFTALSEAAAQLARHDIGAEMVWLGKHPIAGCIACMKCMETGRCVFNDKVNETIERLDEYSGMIIGSPVYYAGPSGQIKCFLDRLFFAGGEKLACKPGAAVVSCRRGGASAAFDALNKYFTIANMPVVSSQYWNQVHGQTPEEVRRDEEGMQTMRTLGQNMAWLLRSIEAGKAAGLPAPKYEEHLWTNFMR
ncbi:MAG: flavodoxin family protein [Cloacibacillus sp.]